MATWQGNSGNVAGEEGQRDRYIHFTSSSQSIVSNHD